MPAPSADASLDRWDWLQCGTLFFLWFCLLVLRNDSLPLQKWDESRLANSALEMAHNGHWLVPFYNGVPDHWSVKPPLLIWQMAALIWLGLPPLLAVRLPTMLAALATVGTVWAVCRYVLHDRAAAVIAGILLLSSSFFTNIHIARTGDYDVPLGLFTLLYVLTFWRSIEQDGEVHLSWFAIFAAALVLAVMVKGVAGTFGLAGLVVFTLIRGRLVTLLGSFYAWLLALLALLLCLGYYGSRELYDPGYMRAVWQEELGGRFFEVSNGHMAGPLHYIDIIIWGFEPGVILLPLAMLTVFAADPRRRSLLILCLSSAAALFVVLEISQTKLDWYLTPILPFLAIATALGITDGLRWIKSRESHVPKLFRARPLQIALGVLLVVVSGASLYRNQVLKPRRAEHGQGWYGAVFDELEARGKSSVIILDRGWEEEQSYNPVLKFYADIARTNGLRVEITPATPASLPTGKLVATCDPNWVPWLKHREKFSVEGQVHSCIFGVAH
jgi:4-amino-4-deoxy-L-arabinose transferase-like glycosyltransferase